MKTILVDAIHTFVIKGEGVFKEIHDLLEGFDNEKIILTNADDEEIKINSLDDMPYRVFTLKHNPNKTNPEYYKIMLKELSLKSEDVICFEHNKEAVKSAQSVGINTYHYDKDKKDLKSLKNFLKNNL